MSNDGQILVLDCGDVSGAFCARVLAGLGARVVRCAEADPWLDGDAEAAAFYRRGVEGCRAGGDALPRELLSSADVVITTGRPSELEAARLDYPKISSGRPNLVVVNISPFGLTGPRCEWGGGNLVATATGGMLYVNGWPDEPPQQPLGLQGYHVAAINGAIGALLALRVRDRGGGGQLVDISLQESVISSVEHVTGMYRESDVVASRTGTLHWTRSFRTVRAGDAEILATHMGDWDVLSAWLESDLEDTTLCDGRWADLDYRRENCGEVFDEIGRWAAGKCAAELVEQAQVRRLPFAPVSQLSEAARHPQLEARGFFEKIEIAGVECRVPERPLPLPAVDDTLSTSDSGLAIPTSSFPTSGSSLDGVRVLDLTWVVAGPAATRILADHGAEVIKVEHPLTATPGPRRGGLFGNLNRGKKSVVVDLGTDPGMERLRRLIEVSDVLVENFSPRVLGNWGLSDEALHKLNPRLTIIHMSGFGRDGPMADWVSYGPTLQSQLGFTAHMRQPGGRPAGWGYSFSDMVSGQVAALGTIASLRAGGGRVVDLSQLEALASVIGPALIGAANGGDVSPAVGNASQEGEISPHGVYRCCDAAASPLDRWCVVSVLTDSQWRSLVEVMGVVLPDARELVTVGNRRRRAAEIDCAIEDWTRGRTVEFVVARLQEVGVPSGVVADARDLHGDDHLRARGMWARVATPEGPMVELDSTPIRMSATPGRIRTPGPALNEHDLEISRLLAPVTSSESA